MSDPSLSIQSRRGLEEPVPRAVEAVCISTTLASTEVVLREEILSVSLRFHKFCSLWVSPIGR